MKCRMCNTGKRKSKVTNHKTRAHYRKGQGSPRGWRRGEIRLVGGGKLR